MLYKNFQNNNPLMLTSEFDDWIMQNKDVWIHAVDFHVTGCEQNQNACNYCVNILYEKTDECRGSKKLLIVSECLSPNNSHEDSVNQELAGIKLTSPQNLFVKVAIWSAQKREYGKTLKKTYCATVILQQI